MPSSRSRSVGGVIAWLRRWWTPTATTIELWIAMSEAPWLGWKAPVVEVSGELLADAEGIAAINPWHRWARHELDRDVHTFVWWPLLPTHWLAWLWIDSRARWCIERWASLRVFDIEEGCVLSSWRWRPLREWTWRRSDGRSPSGSRGGLINCKLT